MDWSCYGTEFIDYVLELRSALFLRLKGNINFHYFVICDNVIVLSIFTIFLTWRASLADSREYFYYFILICHKHATYIP